MNSFMKSLFLIITLITLLSLLSSVPIVASVVGIARFNGQVKGTAEIIFSRGHGDADIIIKIKQGLNAGIKYPYHIHEFAIKDHNCTSAGGHLDPAGVGKVKLPKVYKCDPDKPEECEVGDISGKYGPLSPDSQNHVFKHDKDPFIKVSGENGIEGRSVVIHLPGLAKTRLDCANIELQHNHKRRLDRRS